MLERIIYAELQVSTKWRTILSDTVVNLKLQYPSVEKKCSIDRIKIYVILFHKYNMIFRNLSFPTLNVKTPQVNARFKIITSHWQRPRLRFPIISIIRSDKKRYKYNCDLATVQNFLPNIAKTKIQLTY